MKHKSKTDSIFQVEQKKKKNSDSQQLGSFLLLADWLFYGLPM
jgi:hypothetical protein